MATSAAPSPLGSSAPAASTAPRRQVGVVLDDERRTSTAGRGVSVATALASLDAARTGELPQPAPTATLLVATDPALTAPDESLLLGAAPVPAPTGSAAGAPVTEVAAEPVSWLHDLSTYGMPLLVGGALLLALTGQSGLRRWARRRREV
ncbi:hypothetical protein [Quadrisphaera sp. KR29]|uniref:hypothetical protein n=1 Tax=Quadrisphaera sp. KR29 TaxID=3461391 RepID=UPI004044F95D